MVLRIIKKLVPLRFKKQLKNFYNLSVKYGQFKTITKGECIDKKGYPIPWYTYPAIEFIDNLDFSEKIVFEYGCGNSTLYWGKRAKQVFSVEHDKKWYDKIKSNPFENIELFLAEDEKEYVNIITRLGKTFDVIIIDGVYREKCVKTIEDFLSQDGIVILDNSDWYKESSKYLREKLNLIQVDFHGFGPINDYTWTTSIFFTRAVNIKPISGEQPVYSKCGIINNAEKFD